jgi:dihydropteroate synthase
MPFTPRSRSTWQLRTRTLELGRRTVIMGVLNVTPDSFSDGGLYPGTEDAVQAGLRMLSEGATIVDMGGESTRPGKYAKPTPQMEADRVLPVIEGLRQAKPDALLSIDTYHASTASQAVAAGSEIVNDVSGLLWDPAMAETCAALCCGVVLMHTRGRPEEWKTQASLARHQVVPLVVSELAERASAAQLAGILPGKLVLDPGFGFGKAFEENYLLLAHLDAIRALGFPVLAGVSRKAFLGRTLAPSNGGRDAPATVAAVTAAILSGAEIVRVHDVRAAAEAAAIADAILAAV